MSTLLAWQRAGYDDGPAVVLIHPWGSTGPGSFAPEPVTGLAEAGLDVLVVDLPGHGDSADIVPPDGTSPTAWAAQAVLLDLQRLGVDRAAVVGHADGGAVAAHAAVRDPGRITRLVLVSCDDRTDVPGSREAAAALRDPRARVWTPEAAELLARVRGRRHHHAALADWLEHRTWPAAPRLGALRTPVLVAVGSSDPHRERVPRLASVFHDARVVTVPGGQDDVLVAPEIVAALHDFVVA